MKLQDVAAALGGTLMGDPEHEVFRIAALAEATEDTLTFVLSDSALALLAQRSVTAAITYKALPDIANQIVVKNPRKALGQTIALFYPTDFVPLISSSATIDPSASITTPTHIREGVSIGANVRIGSNCTIYPNVTIYANCVIGDNVIIHAGTVVGSDGFGFYSENGKWGKIPHIGRVVIGDDVEIGANVTIDRGVLEDTIIGSGTKIDNLCQIAHNTRIGNDAAFAGQAGTVGHAIVGNRVQVGGQAGISAVIVGDDSVIAARSGVTRNVGNRAMVSGFPAGDHFQELKKDAWLRQQFRKRKELK